MPEVTQISVTLVGEPAEFVSKQAAKAGISPDMWVNNLVWLSRKTCAAIGTIMAVCREVDHGGN